MPPHSGEASARLPDPAWALRPLCVVAPLILLAACASAPLTHNGALTSYEGLTPSNGAQAKARLRVSKTEVAAAKTVRITPTRFADGIGRGLSGTDRALMVNRVDRALCHGLSERFDVVDPSQPADLSIQATITHLGKTDRIAAGASVVVSFVSVVPAVSPRVPFGLGSLTIEAEALTPTGDQAAAMIWSKGASYISVLGSTTVSAVGDAYQLAPSFGTDFAQLLATGETPFGNGDLIKLNGKPDAACGVYGDDPGVGGFIAENFGLPPDWTDKGARRPKDGKAKGSSSRTAP
jgi:hypothetical protein